MLQRNIPLFSPLSSSSRLPQIIPSLLLMEIPSDPNLLPDEFNPLHVSIIQAFNPIYGGLGRTGRSKCKEISGIRAVCSKPTPKYMKLSSQNPDSGGWGAFQYLAASYLSWSKYSGPFRLIESWVILLPRCAWQFPLSAPCCSQGLTSIKGFWLISPCVCIDCKPASRTNPPAWPLSQPAISTILGCWHLQTSHCWNRKTNPWTIHQATPKSHTLNLKVTLT